MYVINSPTYLPNSTQWTPLTAQLVLGSLITTEVCVEFGRSYLYQHGHLTHRYLTHIQ